ncbi:MAG TPA: N-acetylmuramoyl-L-alanine amidase [Firmicutes bacterium]|nr:N-acetylmuramoyl-L-alanine amidase [Bacillota bacterium]
MSKIAVFAGHGGDQAGAQYNGYKEKDVNLAVSNALTEILRSRGYTVINNRTTDVNRSIVNDARMANEQGVDAVVELHMNANEGEPFTGTEVYYSIFDKGTGRRLAQAIVDNIAALGFVNRGIKTRVNSAGQDYFGIIRLTRAPAVLVEMAFLNNPDDMARFNVDEIANAIANGIEEVIPPSQEGQGGPNETPPAPPSSGGLPYPMPNYDLSYGATGDGVRWLQWYLNRLGYLDTPQEIDGIFGARTQAALENFQRDAGIRADGIAGRVTRAALIAALS